MIGTLTLSLLTAFGADGADASNAERVGLPVPEVALERTAPQETLSDHVVVVEPAEERAAFVPPPEPPRLLVGREAWLTQKFLADPFMDANHGQPTVFFAPQAPTLRR